MCCSSIVPSNPPCSTRHLHPAPGPEKLGFIAGTSLKSAPCAAPPQVPETQAPDEDDLIELLCRELLQPAAAGSTAGCDAATISTAAAAVAAQLCGQGSFDAAAAAVASLFPTAASISVSCPTAAGGHKVMVICSQGSASAAVSLTHTLPVPLRPALGACGRCSIALPYPPAASELQLLETFDCELGRRLGQLLKEQREAAYNRLSGTLRHKTAPARPATPAPAVPTNGAASVHVC